MLELAFLRWLVVIRICRKNGVNARNLAQNCGLPQENTRAVVGAAGPDGNATGSGFDHDADGLEPFLLVESRSFAGRSTGDDKVDACINLPVYERPKCRFIDRSVFPERRNDCRATTCRFHHEKCISTEPYKAL